MTTVVYAVDIKAPAADVFRAVVDWPGQDQWIPLTQVRATAQAGVGVGGEIEAFTGIGKLGFLDTMTITRWDAPLRVDVLHTGAVVKGIGIMSVRPLTETTSRFYWAEELQLPLGPVGLIGWQFIKPFFGIGMRKSLGDFARLVERGELGTEPMDLG